MINSSAMLLEWLGARHDDEAGYRAAALVEQAVTATVKGGVATRDLGGTASTSGFAAAVVDAIGRRRRAASWPPATAPPWRWSTPPRPPWPRPWPPSASGSSAGLWHLLDDRLACDAERAGGLAPAAAPADAVADRARGSPAGPTGCC